MHDVAGGGEWVGVATPDGRDLEVRVAGAVGGLPLVVHDGTPAAAARWPQLDRAAQERGLRLIQFSRPGYAESSPHPGRSVADVAADVVAVLGSVDGGEFVSMGWSGGGPHAIACAALLPDRCRAAASVAGVAPHSAEGLDWLAGMGESNVEEFSRAVQGADALSPFLLRYAAEFAELRPDQLADALGGLVSPVDRAALTGDLAEWLALAAQRAVSRGIEGWLEDDLAFVKPWGFELGAITRPVAVWQGGEDRMVPFAHGQWLAEHIPTASRQLHEGEGHLSLTSGKLPLIIDDLLRLAGRSG